MSIPLEKQLKTLSDCGIKLLPGITIEHLLSSFDREIYEQDPFEFLLITLGGEIEVEPFGFFTDNIWHFDTECIEDHGDYTMIAHRMMTLAGGTLPLEGIGDYIDLEDGEAGLSFRLKGEQIKWEAEINDDWADPQILTRFAQLLERQATLANRFADLLSLSFGTKRFTYLDLKGQDCLLGCSTAKQLKRLRRETGLDFRWLS